MTKQAKQEVAIQEAEERLPAVIDYGDDAGAGLEDMQRDEFKIPLLGVLQSNSPQCKPESAGGTAGAKAGMIYNSATQEMWDVEKTPLVFVPCYRDHNYVEYVPRNLGGGFAGIRAVDDPLVKELREKQGRFGRLSTATKFGPDGLPLDGTEITETFYLFGLVVAPDGAVQQDVVPFKSTQIGVYQNFMTRYTSIKYPNRAGAMVLPPLWAHRWQLGTRFSKNKKGEFFGWTLRLEKEPPLASRLERNDPLYEQAAAFYAMLKEGRGRVEHEAASASEPEQIEIPF